MLKPSPDSRAVNWQGSLPPPMLCSHAPRPPSTRVEFKAVGAEFTGGSVLLGPGTLYRCLKDLAADGFIERVPPPESDNPHRKYYGLTSKGKGELSAAATELRRVTKTAETRLGGLSPEGA